MKMSLPALARTRRDSTRSNRRLVDADKTCYAEKMAKRVGLR